MIKRIKNKQKKLGNNNKQLIIRLLKRNVNYYDIVMTRRKAKPTSRLSKLGSFQLIKNEREKYTILKMDHVELKNAISAGAIMHRSFIKLLIS